MDAALQRQCLLKLGQCAKCTTAAVPPPPPFTCVLEEHARAPISSIEGSTLLLIVVFYVAIGLIYTGGLPLHR